MMVGDGPMMSGCPAVFLQNRCVCLGVLIERLFIRSEAICRGWSSS